MNSQSPCPDRGWGFQPVRVCKSCYAQGEGGREGRGEAQEVQVRDFDSTSFLFESNIIWHGRLSGSEGWRDSLWNSDQPCHCLRVSHQCLESERPLVIFVAEETALDNTFTCIKVLMNPSLGFCSTRVLGSWCRNFFLFRLRQVLSIFFRSRR